MGGPLIVLALITLLLGFGQHGLERFLGAGGHATGPSTWLLITALVLTAAGIGLAWMEFGRRSSRQEGFVERSAGLKALFGQRWYLDHIYRWLLDVVVYKGFSAVCTRNDQQVIDGAIDGFSLRTVASGRLVSAVHSGMIQYRLLIMFAVVVLLALYFFL
jgi:NADH-quinone oxidoreductase subunit L